MKGGAPSGNGAWVGKLAVATCLKCHLCFSKSQDAQEKMDWQGGESEVTLKKIIKDALLRKGKAQTAPPRLRHPQTVFACFFVYKVVLRWQTQANCLEETSSVQQVCS